MTPPRRTFASKVDLSLALIAALGFGGSFLGAGILLLEGTTMMTVIGSFALLMLVVALTAAFPLRYHLEETEIRIQSGWLVFRIALADIVAVSPSSPGLIAAPAWSRDRIIITYRASGNRRSMHIAPEPREEFLTQLADLANLERSGARLLRDRQEMG